MTREHGFAQQGARVGTLELRIGVGEMAADIAQGRRTEDGVGDRVQQHVGVGVAQQAQVVRDLHAADDQVAVFHQRVAVIALADTER